MINSDFSGIALVITAVGTAICTVVGAFASFYVLVRKQTQVQAAVAEVKDISAGNAKVLEKVHALTNSAMTAALQSAATALRANAISLRVIYGVLATEENKALMESAQRAALAAEAVVAARREQEAADPPASNNPA